MSPQPVWGRGPGSGRHATGATPRGRAASAARLAAPSYARFSAGRRDPPTHAAGLELAVGRGGRVRRARARARARHVADSVSIFTRDIRSRGSRDPLRRTATRSRDPAHPRPDPRVAHAAPRDRRVLRRPRSLSAARRVRLYSSTDTPKWRRRSCEDVIGVEMKTLPVKTRVPCVCVPPTSRLT